MKSRLKRRWAPTSPKTDALAFISVLPWRINDGGILGLVRRSMVAVNLQSLHETVTKISVNLFGRPLFGPGQSLEFRFISQI